MPALLSFSILCYPLVVHFSIYLGQLMWAVYFLMLLLFVPGAVILLRACFIKSSLKTDCWRGAGLVLVAILIFRFADAYPEILLQLQPMLIFVALFVVFTASLRNGATPVISRFAIVMNKDISTDVLNYTRRATVAWAIFFLLMLIVSVLLAMFSSLYNWSLFTNFLSYLLVGMMFIVEFVIRRRVLGNHVDYSFIEFIRRLRQVKYRDLSGGSN